LPQYLQQANNALFSVNPLTFDEIKQREISGRANIYEYWKTSDAQVLLNRYKDLRFSPIRETSAEDEPKKEDSSETVTEHREDRSFTETEKGSLEWQLKFRQFLISMERWDGENEKSKLSRFHQTQVLYQGLFEIVPRGSIRNEAIRSWVSSLSDGEVEALSRIEWYLYVYYLSQAAGNLTPETRDKILELMIVSNNPALSIYGKLAKLKI